MDDYFRRRLQESLKDTMKIVEEAQKDKPFEVPDAIVGQMAINLFQARINRDRNRMNSSGKTPEDKSML